MKIKHLLSAAVLLISTLTIKAQAPTKLPCMSDPQMKDFDFWIGEWTVYDVTTKAEVGHSLIERVSGGCAILENWTDHDGVNAGKSLNYVDRATHLWKQTWVGSEREGQQDFEGGEYKDGAMRFTFSQVNARGIKLIGRFIFYNEGPDKVRQFNEVSADGGKTWTTQYNFSYIRKKK